MPSRRDVQIKGLQALRAKLKALGRNWPLVVEKALRQEASLVMDDAHDRTPIDLGTLRGTYALDVKRTKGRITAILQVGGPAAPYAIHVHERPELKHTVGEAFYLKNAIDAVRHSISERIGARIKQNHGLR